MKTYFIKSSVALGFLMTMALLLFSLTSPIPPKDPDPEDSIPCDEVIESNLKMAV